MPTAEVGKPTSAPKGTGLPQNTAAALSYVLGWLSGLFFLFVEKDEFVRFHAMQSIVVFGALTILSLLPIIGLILSPIAFLAGLALWLILVVKAYQGERYKLPYVGDFAEKQLGRMRQE